MRRYAAAALVLALAAGAAYLVYRRSAAPMVEPLQIPAPSVEAPSAREVDLYFADGSERRLALERREVSGQGPEAQMRAALEELVRGPEGEGRVRTLPEGTRVRALYLREGTAWVDFEPTIRTGHPGGSWTEVLAVYSVVNTLTENFPEVQRVQILVGGEESETLAGHVDISGPLEARVQLLAGEWE